MKKKSELRIQIEDMQEQLKSIVEQLELMDKRSHELWLRHETEGKRSIALLYIGVLFGAVLGVTGDFFVSYWLQEPSGGSLIGLTTWGLAFALMIVYLFILAKKHAT